MTARKATCAGCGTALPPSKGGPPRKWCSDTCRQHTLYSGECVDCGASTYSGSVPPPERCVACGGAMTGARIRREWVLYQRMVEEMWAEGMTSGDIAEALGRKGVNVSALRARGYNLPHRRTPEQVARITAGCDERMAKARAARRAAA